MNCQGILKEIHDCLGASFARTFDVKFTPARQVSAVFGGPIHQCARSYLPIWRDGNGNYVGIHLDPRKTWQQQAWVTLYHDSADPVLIASSFKVLPRVLHLTTLSYYPGMSAAQWRELESLARRIPNADASDLPARGEVISTQWAAARGELDPGNLLEALISMVNRCATPEEAFEVIQTMAAIHPADPYLKAILAIAQGELVREDAAVTARRAMLGEFPWKSERRMQHFPGRTTVMDIWTRLRDLIIEANVPVGDLQPLLAEDVLETDAGVAAAMSVSKRLFAAGRTLDAFHVARNGLTLAAEWGELSSEWFTWMRTVTEAVGPDSAALDLLDLCRKTFVADAK